MKRKRKAYIIGPYRDERGMWFIQQNIHRARTVAVKLWQRGYAVFCPHSNSMNMDGGAADCDFLDGDLEWMIHADVAFVVPDITGLKSWRESRGSLGEIHECSVLDIPVVRLNLNATQTVIEIPEEWNDGYEEIDTSGDYPVDGAGAPGMHAVGNISDPEPGDD